MRNRFAEFFEGENRRMSMPRLMMFMSFFPATIVVVKTENENIFGWYLSAYAAAYGMARLGAVMEKGKNANSKPAVE